MKKLLALTSSITLITTPIIYVTSCKTFDNNGTVDNENGYKKEQEAIKELKQTDTNWDYKYKNKLSYQKAREYYLKTANDFYGNFIKNWVDEGKSENEIWYSYGDIYFQSIIWYANEAQWDLVRIDEFDGNYIYNQIDINQLNQNSYSKKWFQLRLKVLNLYISYYLGGNEEIKSQGKWGIYAMGINSALARYKTAKQAQIDNPSEGINVADLQKDMKFIDDLTTFWKTRFDKIQRLHNKINDILVNWE